MNQDAALAALIHKITIVPDETALGGLLAVLQTRAAGARIRVAFVNAHAVNLCYSDAAFLRHLLACDYVFRDGSGLNLLYRFLNKEPGLNLNGTDLVPRIMDLYRGHQVAMLGTAQPWLSVAAGKVVAMGLDPSVILDGFGLDETYVPALSAGKMPLIVLAMGMPKQERVAELIARDADFPCLIVCGGAIFDFMGEKFTRAPVAFRQAGMEWLYRLLLEPRRLFRRYAIGNFVFAFRSARFARAEARMREDD